MDWQKFQNMIFTIRPELKDPKSRVSMLAGDVMLELKRAYEAGKYSEGWHSEAARTHVKGGQHRQ